MSRLKIYRGKRFWKAELKWPSWSSSSGRSRTPGLSRHSEQLATWKFLCWFLLGYPTVLLIFVKVDYVSEGSWRSFCDPSGLRIISAPTEAIGLRFFVLSSDKPLDVSADSCWSRRSFWDFLKTLRTLLLIPGLSRHPEMLTTWDFLCWILMGYQTVLLIFVKVDDVSEGSWRLFRSRLLIPGLCRH